jgi:hypothetical protein
MKIEIDLENLVKNELSINQYSLLFLYYHKKFDLIKSLFGVSKAIEIRNSLTKTKYLLSDENTKFLETILSNNEVTKLLGVKSDLINFWEFYNNYPIRIHSRVLRAARPDSEIAKKHEKKYLSRVKTQEQHQKAIQAITVFISKQKQAGKLEFLPNIETVMNNSLWESWESLIEESGSENSSWNTDAI